MNSPFNTTNTGAWNVERDHSTDAVTLQLETANTVDCPHGATLCTEQTVEADVTASDPQTASVRTETSAGLVYDTETVRAVSTSRISRDVTTIATSVTVDDELFDER